MQTHTPLELKRVDAEGRFTGLAATFGPLPDRQGDVIAPGAFKATLAAFKANGGRLPLLWNHDSSEPVGAILKAQETDEGLEVEAVLALETSSGKRAFNLLKTGGLSMSIGFTIPEGTADQQGTKRVLREVDLYEVSLVAVPANPGATIRSVKSLFPTPRDLERAARDALGLSAREAKRLAAGGYSALVKADPDDLDEDATSDLAARLQALTQQLRGDDDDR